MLARAALLALLTTGLLRAETFRDASTETRPLDPHGSLRIDDTNGSIEIKTWDRPEASIQIEKRATSEDTLKGIDVTIDSEPNSLSIRAHFPHPGSLHSFFGWLRDGGGAGGEVRFVVTVPATVDLNHLGLVNGSITVAGVRGAVEAHTVNGVIHASDLRDNADLTTVNGEIHAEVAQLGTAAHLHLSTINGAIALLLPREAAATISLSTINGGASCELPLQSTESGYHRSLRGQIGGGGGTIIASTINGSIRLQHL